MKQLLPISFFLLVFICNGQTNRAFTHYRSILKADSLYNAKDYKNSAIEYSRTFQQNPNWVKNNDRFNAARAFAMADLTDSAFVYLNHLLIKANYSNEAQLLADNGFANINKDKRWQVLIKLVNSNKKKADIKLNKNLITELDSIYIKDQRYRKQLNELEKKYGQESAEVKDLWKTISLYDSLNLISIKAMIEKYGWLGNDIVGSKGSSTIFLVIQHADLDTQLKYLPLFREAVRNNKASNGNLCLLEDRVALQQGKSQIYGTQLIFEAGKWKLAPIVDEKNVNIRRIEAGLEPLEIYAKRFNIIYQLPID